MKHAKIRAKLLVISAALLALPLSAHATLGGDAGTAAADQVSMKAAMRTTIGAKFTVQEMTLPTGTTVREYITPQGQVFAVAWKGPFKPDLRQLMGTYFDRYVEAAQTGRGGHSASRIALPDLVVHSMGHMRAFAGHAYLPAMLPSGVTESELQ